MIRKLILAAMMALVISPARADVTIPIDPTGRITASALTATLNAMANAGKDASNITTGILAVDRLPAIPAAKITGLSAASVAGLGSYVLADSTGDPDAGAPDWMFWPGAGIALSAGAFTTIGEAMGYDYSDFTDSYSMNMNATSTNVFEAGQSVQFNYVLLNAQSRIRPQDFGAAIIYLGR